MDLTLPPTAPSLGQYMDFVWDHASFALYSLVNSNQDQLQALASDLDQEWWDEQGREGSHLVRVAPSSHDHPQLLTSILNAHIALAKETAKKTRKAKETDIEWYPPAFIVLTTDVANVSELLFVFVDDEDETFPVDSFFFKVSDAHTMLSSIAYGDESCVQSKEYYAVPFRDVAVSRTCQ